MVKLLGVVNLLHAHIVLRLLSHQPGQIAVHGKENVYADAVIGSVKQGAVLRFAKVQSFGQPVEPAGRSANHGNASLKAGFDVLEGSFRPGELDGNIGFFEIFNRKIRLVVQVNGQHDLVTACFCKRFDGFAHFSEANNCNVHFRNAFVGIVTKFKSGVKPTIFVVLLAILWLKHWPLLPEGAFCFQLRHCLIPRIFPALLRQNCRNATLFSLKMWQDLVKNALLGTENSRFKDSTLDALAELGIDTAQEPSLVLADGAALLAQMRRAGFFLTDFDADLPQLAHISKTKTASFKTATHLHLILTGAHRAVLPEFLALMKAAGVTLPTAEIPALMQQSDLNLLWTQIEPLLEEAGLWLLRQHPDWSQRLQDPSKFDWQTGSRSERLAQLRFWRRQSPGFALQLLESTWESESLADKTAFLPILETGISLDDEPFLERCLDDKRQDVRLYAAHLLTKIPGSQLLQRMGARAAALLRWDGKKLIVSVLDELDASALRDGLLKFKSKEGAGASYIVQMLSQLPPSFWEGHFGKQPLDILRLFATTDWCASLITGLLHGLNYRQSPDWAAALVAFWYENEDLAAWGNYNDLELFRQVFGTELNRLAIHFLNETNSLPTEHSLVFRLLKNNPAAWTDELSLLIVRRFRMEIVRDYRQIWQLQHLKGYLEMLGLHCNPDLFDQLQTGWTSDSVQWRMWEKPVEDMLTQVLFRKEMRKELMKADA